MNIFARGLFVYANFPQAGEGKQRADYNENNSGICRVSRKEETMTMKPLMAVLLAASLSLPAIHAEARGTANQKKATLAGAAAGAALGGLLGNDGQSAIIGAVAGGLAGNAYAYHNKKMNQKDEDIALRDRRYRDSRYYDYDYDRYGYDYGDSYYRDTHYKKKYKHKHHRKHYRDWDDDYYDYDDD